MVVGVEASDVTICCCPVTADTAVTLLASAWLFGAAILPRLLLDGLRCIRRWRPKLTE